jgi:hypothetical protein
MGDPPANMRNPTKSPDEKRSYEDPVNQTWITSVANVTRFLSEKFLAWGVEARGAYRTLTSGSGLIGERFACMVLDRYPPRRRRGQNRNTFHQDILYMVFCEYEHPVVRVPFALSRIALVSRDLHFGFLVDSRREPWAR